MNFKTLYYTISLTINAKNTEYSKVYKRSNVRFDYETNKKVVKKLSILTLFEKEITAFCNEYQITTDDIELDCKVYQTINIDPYIVIKYLDKHILFYTLDNKTFEDKIAINQYLTDKFISFEIIEPNSILQYKIDIQDGVRSASSFMKDNKLSYEYHTKNLKVEIKSYYEDILIDTFKKSININKLAKETKTIKYKKEIDNRHHNDLNLFQTGLDGNHKKPYLTDKNNTNIFDVRAILKTIEAEPTYVYPKITASYKVYCDYTYQVDKVFGNFSYSANIKQHGYAKVKLVKYATKPFRCEYDLECNATYFSNGDWKTKKIVLHNVFDYNMMNNLYVGDKYNDIAFNDGVLKIKDQGDTVYTLLKREAIKETGVADDKYKLHSFKIENIKSYDMNGNSLGTDGMSAIVPVIPGSDTNLSTVDTSQRVTYIVQPKHMYSGCKYIDTEVGSNGTNLDSLEKNFDFDIFDQDGNKYDGKDFKTATVVEQKDSFISSTADSETGPVSLTSTKSYSYSGSHSLDDVNTAVTIDLCDLLHLRPTELSNSFDATVTINCSGPEVYHNGQMISAGSSKTINLKGTCESLIFGVCGSVHKVELHEHLTHPVEGEYKAAINGNEKTYLLEPKGKDDYNSKEAPFLIPSYAYNIKYKVDVYNIVPEDAKDTVKVTMIPTKNKDEYSMILKMTSDYMANVDIDVKKYVGTQLLGEYRLMDNYCKQYDFKIKRPKKDHEKYFIEYVSDNPNIIFNYRKIIHITEDVYDDNVTCKASKHPACHWNLMVEPCYCYIGEDEYFLYDKYITAKVENEDTVNLNKVLSTSLPVCIMNNGRTLQRVISTEDDGITIKENLTGRNGLFYTTYTDIAIDKVINLKGEAVPYIAKKHYFICDENECIVFYKVIDSFDYKANPDNTVVKICSINNGEVEVFLHEEKEDINTKVSLNPIHSSISEGYVFISDTEEEIKSHEVTINSVNNVHNIIVRLFDKYKNPVSKREADIDITSTNPNTAVENISKIDDNGILQVILKSDKGITNECIVIYDKNNTYMISLANEVII